MGDSPVNDKTKAFLLAAAASSAFLGSAAQAAPADGAAAPSGTATAADTPSADAAAADAPPPSDIAQGSEIVVTATRPNELAPVTVSLQATQPQAIVSRSFIEDSLPATADFNQIALITPSVSNFGGVNGVGLSESKAQIRGFQDGEYNVTYDGIPFGDTNDPTHHSNTFFPSNTIETLVVDRGPGNASQLGQATFGGNINLFSRVTTENPGAELKGTYGTWNTLLARAVLQSGAVRALGGSEFMLSGQHTQSDGARSFSPFKSNNLFGKASIPLGPNVRLTLLATYNENRFNQPDKDGTTLSQVAAFGRNFSLNDDPNSQNYFKYNHTHKTTDFEIARLEANFGGGISFDNRAYTYSYDNETLSGNDVTLFATATPAQIAAADTVVLTPGAKAVFGVPGYTKTNKYRVWGDIPRIRADFGSIGTLVLGLWLERSNTYRQQRDVDLVTMQPNFAEKAVKDPVTGAATPANIKFDQHSHITNIEEFAELELHPLAGLTVTPGFKHASFRREISASYNQTTRIPQQESHSYKADLPFLTLNYAASQRLSFYAEYARGFLMPPLSALYVINPQLSSVQPQRSTNYQAGAVYHGSHVSLDADVYHIDFRNKFASFTSPVPGEGVIFINQGRVIYQGVEGQATWAPASGIALFVNGSLNYAKTDNAGAPHTQVANAPFSTAAAGVIFRHGPLRASFVDKYTGKQFGVDGEVAAYRIPGYNTANLSASYEIGPVRVGVEVSDLFDSTKVVNIAQGKTAPFDQYFFQPGRAVTADVTLRF
jgi:iron complex outermembrane receptor protein